MSRGFTLKLPEFKASVIALERRLNERLAETKAELLDVARKTAAEAAEALAATTFPHGNQFARAKARLSFDLTRIYATGGKVFQDLMKAGESRIATEFYRNYKSRNFAAANRVLRKSATKWSGVSCGNLNPAFHRAAWNASSGKISISHPMQIVSSEDLKFYTGTALKKLGKTASGWLACAEQLGGDGNKPKWKGTSIHGASGGRVQIQETATGITITLANTRPLARKHISPAAIRNIQNLGRRKMTDRILKSGIMRPGS